MKFNRKSIALALATLGTLNAQLSTCHAQGTLTPPGAPVPTMKSLAQIEPRTPISSVPFTIATSGSYYLTTNLTTAVSNAIVITASEVTLDLSGFTIASTVASAANGGAAILLSGPSSVSDITIMNGHILGGVTNNGSNVYGGSGFFRGIFTAVPCQNVLVSRVTVAGCLNYGIYVDNDGSGTQVDSCVVRTVGGIGIWAWTTKNSTATDCAIYGIEGSSALDCHADTTGSYSAIYCSLVSNSYGNCTGSGSGVTALAAANNCYGYSASGFGVLSSNGTLSGCFGYSGTGTGVSAFIANACHGATASGTALTATHNINSF
jgi:hypothetical protein